MVDIKEWLQNAASNLDPGQVIKPDHLTYLEAMNALEMMDPAMDWGYDFNPHGQFDPHAALSPAQVCWIMDEMCAREVAWLRGGTVAQTFLTSLHYHNPLALQPNVPESDPSFYQAEASCAALRAFVLAFAKGIEVAYYAVLDSGAVRDGEDTWLDTYGVALETTESTDDVRAYVTSCARWLLQSDHGPNWDPNAWVQVVNRLNFQLAWMDTLSMKPARRPGPIHLAPESAKVDWAFDSVTPFLRQNMPLPVIKVPSHAEAWATFAKAMEDMDYARALAKLGVSEREMALLRGRGEMLPTVRALWKVLLVDNHPVNTMVDEWLSDIGHENVLRDIDTSIQKEDRWSFSYIRDITGGTLAAVLSSSLQNPSRTRRAYEHYARTWAEQAAAAERLTKKCPSARPLIKILQGRALDCQLNASLLAFELGLIGQNERRMMWWWVTKVAGSRSVLDDSWQARWADAWASIAAAMVLLYTAIPAGKTSVPKNQFMLRHKLALRGGLLKPSWEEWEVAQKALDGVHRKEALGRAEQWLIDGEEKFGIVDSRTLRTTSLQQVAHENAALLKQAVPLEWKEEMCYSIPRLQRAEKPAQA